MVLEAADSTFEGMLSLNVNVVEEGAGASSSQYWARVMVGGAGTVHHNDMGTCVKSQASVRAYRQATAREVCSRRIAPELGEEARGRTGPKSMIRRRSLGASYSP